MSLISELTSPVRVAQLVFTVAFAVAVPGAASATHIDGLTIDVTIPDGEGGEKTLGQIRLHVGTHDFSATGNEGIGKATVAGEQSGFYTPAGMTLADMAQMAGEHHFNWLQIVKVQPPEHEDTFGAVPHADPSNDPDNPTPHDDQPWYLNESAAGGPPAPAINPPFDLPPDTASLLPYQDFPSAFELGDMIEFDTYLVSIVKQSQKQYDIHAGFTWKVTYEVIDEEEDPRAHVVNLEEIGLDLSPSYQSVVSAYADMGWTLVPEPGTGLLVGLGLLALGLGRNRGAFAAAG
jgi:hypothetical protein